jgi:hypothetical protein
MEKEISNVDDTPSHATSLSIDPSTASDLAALQCVCSECGNGFEPYKRGAIIVKSMCPDCMTKKLARKAHSPASGDNKPDSLTDDPFVTIVFSGQDRLLFTRISDLSKKDRRSMESQVLFWLEHYVPELSTCLPIEN